jgi:hypothetical protein
MTPCLNEETLQAYFDGELAPPAAAQVIKHLAECDGCASSAFEVERAIELMASAFDDELPEGVPSERMRERIAAALAGNSVSQVMPARGLWQRILESLVLNPIALSPRRLAYASLGILALMGALWLGARSEFFEKEQQQANNDKIEVPTPTPPENQPEQQLAEQSPDAEAEKPQPEATGGANERLAPRQFRLPKRYASTKPEDPILPVPNDPTYLAEVGPESVGISGDSLATDGVVFDSGMIQHFEKAQILLRSFRNSDTSRRGFGAELAQDRRQSQSLLYRNILLRRNAENRGNLPAEEVLGSLEPVLLDIANLPDRASAEDVRSIKERINKMEIIGVLQVYSAPSMLAANQQY